MWASQVLPASRRSSANVVVGSRVATPGSLPLWRELHERGKRLVLDIDDNYFAIEPTNRVAYEAWHPNSKLIANLRESIQLSDTVTTCSDYLSDVIRRQTGHPDVRTVPNGLHAGLISQPRSYHPDYTTIGWAGSGDTIRSLGILSRPLKRILDYKTPTGKPVLQLVGTSLERAAEDGLSHPRINACEWATPGRNYLGWVSGFDVWVAPYADTEFNRSKFPTKALEAAFLGIPLVVSDIHPYREWARRWTDTPFGIEGALRTGVWLIRDDYEWSHALRKLTCDPDLRRSVGQAGRVVASQFTMQNLGETWERALLV